MENPSTDHPSIDPTHSRVGHVVRCLRKCRFPAALDNGTIEKNFCSACWFKDTRNQVTSFRWARIQGSERFPVVHALLFKSRYEEDIMGRARKNAEILSLVGPLWANERNGPGVTSWFFLRSASDATLRTVL